MSYLVLARKWRPKNFDDVVGQDYITTTLRNAIYSGHTPHAMIMSGPRGVGKTSMARIVAKTLNCEKFPSEQAPCNACSFCIEIQEGRSLDVMEIDAASHTGVNDVREIINDVKYVSASGKWKIYIIDEAHMLSQSAFNALLKTLEEPPPQVLFILATTELHKIPATILSRCQRQDFKKVTTELIKGRIKRITTEEGIQLSENALYTVAKEADGSLRDSLSILDQLVATFGTVIEEADVQNALGITDRATIAIIIKSIFERNPKKCIEVLSEVATRGISSKRFAEDILTTLRNALVIKVCGGDAIRELSSDDISELEGLVDGKSVETLETLFKLMLEGTEEVSKSAYTSLALESLLIKLTLINNVTPLDEILKKIETLEKKLGSRSSGVNDEKDEKLTPSERRKPISSAPAQVEQPAFDEEPGLPEKGIAGEEMAEEEILGEGLSQLSDTQSTIGAEHSKEAFLNFVKSKNSMMGIHLEEASDIKVVNGSLIIEFPKRDIHCTYLQEKTQQRKLENLAKDFYDKELKAKVVVNAAVPNGSSKPPVKEKAVSPAVEASNDPVVNDPAVKMAIDLFGGKILKVNKLGKE